MKIAIDYTLAKYHSGGMGVFVRNIVKELRVVDKKNRYLVFTNPNKFQKRDLITKIISAIKEHFWYQTVLLSLLDKNKADILYSPNPPVPVFSQKPIILTIPDMAFYSEKSIPSLIKAYLFAEYYLAARKAKIVTTFSEYSKNDIQKILGINPNKIQVIPLAASKKFKKNGKKKEVEETLRQYHITKPFILCTPGSFLPRKNVCDLILAVYNLPTNLKKNLEIVLVGNNKGIYFEKLNNYINKLDMGKNVIFTGYIKSESKNLINVYSAAKIFVYPSLYEGFGLPPIEAMGCEIPTVVYNTTSLPEVVGNASIIVNNHKELTKAIQCIIDSEELQKKLISMGKNRVKIYNWNNSAAKFVGLIKSLE